VAGAGTIFIDVAMNVANIENSVKKINGSLQGFAKKTEGIGKVIGTAFKFAAVGAGVVGVVKTVQGLTSSLKSLADEGERAGDIEAGFEKLGGSAAVIEDARSRTLGLASSFDLMRVASKGMAAEIPQFNENFAQVADLGARLADTLGIDTTEGIEKVTAALAGAKTGALQQIGFVVDTKKAYADYAAQLGVTSEALTESEKKHAKQAQAVAQLAQVTAKFAPLGDSVSTAADSIGNSWNKVVITFGRAINENEALTSALRGLEHAVSTVDLTALGHDAAELATVLVRLTQGVAYLGGAVSSVIPDLTQFKQNLLNTLHVAANWQGSIKETSDALTNRPEIQQLTKNIRANIDQMKGWAAEGQKISDARIAAANRGFEQLKQSATESPELSGQVARLSSERVAAVLEYNKKISAANEKEEAEERKGALEEEKREKEREKAREHALQQFSQYTEKVRALKEENFKTSISDNIQDAIGNLDTSSFDRLVEQFKTHAADGIRAELQEAIAAGVKISSDDFANIVESKSEKMVEPFRTAMAKAVEDDKADRIQASQEVADKLAEQLKEAYQESTDFWRGAFEDLFSGNGFDTKSWMRKLASGFAAELMNAVAGPGIGQALNKPGDLGASILQGLGGIGGTSLLGSLPSLFSSSEATIQGPLTQAGQAASDAGMGRDAAISIGGASSFASVASSAGAAYGYAQLLNSLTKVGSGSKSNYTAAASAIGTAIGARFGGPVGAGIGAAIGNAIGKQSAKWFGIGGPRNEETLARKAAANAIETIFDQVSLEGGVRFINEKGKVGVATDITENPFDHFKNFDAERDFTGKWGKDSASAFQGVGAGIADQFGMGEQASQMGVMLAESFQGSLEGLKAFVQAIGATQEQITDSLLKRGKMGSESWLEIVTEIHGAAKAFEKGLTGPGQYAQALENLAKSSGRGQLALNQLKNIAIEAGEVGIKSVAQLQAQRNSIIASGKMTAEEFDALMKSLQQHGIKQLDQLGKLDDLGLAEIIASMDANLQDMGKTWREVSEDVKSFQEAVNGLDGKTVEVGINVTSNIDDATQDLIDKNILDENLKTKSTLTKAPEETPTADLASASTLTTKKLSTKALRYSTDGGSYRNQGIQLHVDARGAGNGVAQQIVSALSEIEDRIQSNTLKAVYRYVDRI
jgi:hypothetical protein